LRRLWATALPTIYCINIFITNSKKAQAENAGEAARGFFFLLAKGLPSGYFQNMKRRIADIMEKLGVAGLAVGLFQGSVFGYLAGFVCIAYCLVLTRSMEK
jgi:hypothetical protein